jgi:putative ABC transport system substrate-binding protein
MRRRDFIGLFGGAAAWPVVATAQPRMPVIGLLASSTVEALSPWVAAFRKGLAESGYVEGSNVVIENRYAEDQLNRLRALAADLVQKRVSLIAALGNQQTALAAKNATTTIPIVFAIGADPLRNGIVSSLNRPGGNITGMTMLDGVLVSKRMQLLHDLLPTAKVFGVLRNPANNSQAIVDDSRHAVDTWGGKMEVVDARDAAEIDTAFAMVAQKRIDVFNVLPDTLFSGHPEKIVALAALSAVPTIYPLKSFASVGGLMSYGADYAGGYRQAGIYAGRILKGEKPGDLPVQQQSKFEFVINLKTAKALDLPVSNSIQLLADEVIE